MRAARARRVLAGLLAGVCLAALLAAPSPSGAQSAGPALLVAKPSIRDPNFARTVIVVTQAPDGASLGVVINRPTSQSLANILPGHPSLARFTEPLYFGGPVERVGLFALFRATDVPGATFPVVEDLHLALLPATVEQLLLKPPPHVRFFAGYAGWAPGQLAAELRRGDWWTLDVDPALAFRKDTEGLWEELSRRAGSVIAREGAPGLAAAGSRSR